MVIDKKILDELSEKAKSNPRLRMNFDLRNSVEDNSQRMLNALEPGTVMPIHRHKETSETCVCIRGHFEEYFYDENGNLTDTIDMVPGGNILNIEKGQWHSLKWDNTVGGKGWGVSSDSGLRYPKEVGLHRKLRKPRKVKRTRIAQIYTNRKKTEKTPLM